MTITQFNFIDSIKTLVSDLIELSPQVAAFIGCQSALESSYGGSAVATGNHNVFGMKIPTRRGHVRLLDGYGVDKSFAAYRDIFMSCQDYVLWLQYNRVSNKQRSDLASFKSFLVSHHYCDSPDYIASIESVFDSFVNFIKSNQNESV